MRTILFAVCAMLVAQTALFAQDSTDVVEKRTYTTKFLNEIASPEIDGLLNDPAWDAVEWEGDFVERRPDENTTPDHKTKFKIVYDQKFLYVGIRAYDSDPDKIEMRLSRRDGFQGDWVGIFIDSYHDKRSAFSFITTAAGVKADFFSSENGRNEDESWNPIWYTKSNIDEEGWTAEMKIPFSQLKFGKAKEQIWGIQVDRQYFRGAERYAWQRIKQDTPGFVSEFGLLEGLINLEPQKQLEIQPYTVAKLKTFEPEAGNPFQDGKDTQLTGGLDAKIGITNDLTLDLTVSFCDCSRWLSDFL